MKKDYAGKIKLYADENIRYGIVLALRLQGVNMMHSREVGLTTEDDQVHFQYAKKTNRWLLTIDKGLLNHNNI